MLDAQVPSGDASPLGSLAEYALYFFKLRLRQVIQIASPRDGTWEPPRAKWQEGPRGIAVRVYAILQARPDDADALIALAPYHVGGGWFLPSAEVRDFVRAC